VSTARRPGNRLLLAGLLLMAAALLLGLGLAFAGWPDGAERDAMKAIALREGRSPGWLIAVAQWVTWAGDAAQRSIVMLLAAIWLVWRGHWRAGLVMAVVPAVAGATSSILKEAFGRARPDVVPHLDPVASLSYPSGHAVNAAAILLLIALLGGRGRKGWIAAALAGAVLIGGSRLALGVHWPSDVAGGWLWGAGFALTGLWLARRSGDRG
jgi:membrane-associated phospholipid phosphatase